MFENIKLDAKMIAAGAVVVIILVVVGIIWWQHHEVKTLTNENVAASSTIAAQAAAGSEAHALIGNQQATNAVTDAGNAAIIAAPQKNADQQATVQAHTDQTVATIKQQYSTLPQTDANAQAQDKAIAQAQIDGLWTTFCNVEAQAASCK